MKKIVLSLLTVFMVLSLSVVLVKADVTTTVSLEDGVQIRTDGNNGLKWVANVENYAEGNEYGFLFAQGDLAEVTVASEGVVKQVVEGVTLEEPVMSATMVNFPKKAANQDISVVAYVYDGENYSYSNVVVRNLAEVAVYAKNTIDGDFVNAVAEYVGENYKKTFTDAQGSLYYDNALYETNHVVLAEEFIDDWNTLFSTSLDAATTFTGGSSSTWYKSAKTSSQTSWANSKLKEFFQNEAMYAKWGWLLNYIINELSNGTGHGFAKSQAEAIINNVEDTANWYYSGHLCSFVMSFMTGEYQSSGWGSYNFGNYPEKLALVRNYNNTIYANYKYSTLVEKNAIVNLPVPNNKTGYSSNWVYNSVEYADGSEFSLDANTNYFLTSNYKAINYTVSFYDGATNLTNFALTYNIESSDLILPEYEKSGYVFKGWYTTSTFEEGTEIDIIYAGSCEDVVVYAKLEETSNVSVNVTLNPNGGCWDAATTLENATILKQATLTRYLTRASSTGYDASLHTGTYSYWYHLLLKETSISGIYEIVSKGYGATSVTDYNLSIIWHGSLTDATSKTALTALYNDASTIGKYVILENVPAASSSSCSITVNVIDASELTKSLTKTLIEKEELPTPIHANSDYSFGGWKSSVDGSIVTEFPAYSSNPGDITYTAQWESNLKDVTVNFDTNGGAFVNYESVDAAIADFLKDYNTARNKSHTPETFYALGSWGEISDASLFLYNSNYKEKWTWLVNYIAGVAGGANKNAFTNFYNYSSQSELNAANGNYIYSIAYELRGWVAQAKYSQNANFITADYSSATVQAAFNSANTLPLSYVYTDPCTLPKPFKQGYTFKGWYTNESLTGDAVTSYPGYYTNIGEITYYAKWSSSIIVTYDTDPFTEVGNSIQLNAKILGELIGNFVWESKNTSVATVDQNGLVTGVKEGTATIYVYDSGDPHVNLSIEISVVSAGLSDLFSIISDAHNNTVFNRDNLGIGAGTPVYYTNVYGSVSKILYNQPLNIDKTYATTDVDDFDTLRSLEFITVHYTGNMSVGADARANAQYFASENNTSIHYTTGNDGVYQALTHDKGAWHAGDGASVNQVGYFTWNKTGVKYDGGDLLKIKWTASDDFYFEINGKKTSIKLPSTWNYNSRNTDHVFNSDGTISSKSSYAYSFSNRSPESFFNDWGFPVKVENGEYYMGTTWWCYSQVHEGRICGSGGNLNSIGIESCVDKGSDLWYTWQLTAKLVAKLCYENNLGFERIRPHHAYTAKDCPQPLLENNMEIWWEFMDLVKYEYELLTKFSDYNITFVSNNNEFISNNGRVIKVPEDDTVVSYTVTLTHKTTGAANSVTYFATIPGSK